MSAMYRYKILILVFVVCIAQFCRAQVVIPDEPTDPSAEMQVDSDDKAVLFPRLSTVQINSIVNPAHGLLAFNTTLNGYVYNIGTEAVPKWQVLDKLIINTTAEIAAIPTPTAGDIRYNSDTKSVYFYNGMLKVWKEICEDPQCDKFIVGNTVVKNVDCNGNSNGEATITTIAGATPFTYAWPDANTNSSRTDLAAGTYTVTVTDDKGCVKTTDVAITEPTVVTLAPNETIDSCERSVGSVNLDAAGGTPFTGDTYEYSDDNTTWTSNVATQLFSGLTAGNYIFYARDNNGCTKSVPVSITSSLGLSVSFSAIDNEADCGQTNGSANVDVTGGTPFGVNEFDFSWDGLVPERALNGYTKALNSGVHEVVVTDSRNCTDTNNIIINLPGINFTDDGTGVAVVSDGNEAYWSLRRCGDVAVEDMACNCNGTIYYWNTTYDYFADELGNILLPLNNKCDSVNISDMFGHPDNPDIVDKDGDGVIDYDTTNIVNNEIDFTNSHGDNYQFDVHGTDSVYDKNNLIVSPAIYPGIKLAKLFDDEYPTPCNGPGDCGAEYGTSVAYCPELTNEAGDIVDLYTSDSEVSGNIIQQSMEGRQTICTKNFGFGWRLPTFQEVSYSYDVEVSTPDPVFDPAYYNNNNVDGYNDILLYTSTKVTSGDGMIYNFQAILNGSNIAKPSVGVGAFNWSNGYYVRCVFDTDLPLWKTNAECP